jgi:hypothetical protein
VARQLNKGKLMSKLNEFLAIIAFIGDDMTEDQASRLMDKAKSELSIADRQRLLGRHDLPGNFYFEISQHDGEMGGLSRY